MSPAPPSPDVVDCFRRNAVLGHEQHSSLGCFGVPRIENADGLVWGQPDDWKSQGSLSLNVDRKPERCSIADITRGVSSSSSSCSSVFPLSDCVYVCVCACVCVRVCVCACVCISMHIYETKWKWSSAWRGGEVDSTVCKPCQGGRRSESVGYSPFPGTWDSKWSSEYKTESLMVKGDHMPYSLIRVGGWLHTPYHNANIGIGHILTFWLILEFGARVTIVPYSRSVIARAWATKRSVRWKLLSRRRIYFACPRYYTISAL